MEGKTRDEKINGPRAAAKILNSMPPERKKFLLSKISLHDPDLFHAISLNIVNFEDIIEISDVGIQRLIKELKHQDLVLALKNASPEVSDALFRNMSSGKRRIVLDDLAALTAVQQAEIEEAQRQVCVMIDRLRTIGAIFSNPDDVM